MEEKGTRSQPSQLGPALSFSSRMPSWVSRKMGRRTALQTPRIVGNNILCFFLAIRLWDNLFCSNRQLRELLREALTVNNTVVLLLTDLYFNLKDLKSCTIIERHLKCFYFILHRGMVHKNMSLIICWGLSVMFSRKCAVVNGQIFECLLYNRHKCVYMS